LFINYVSGLYGSRGLSGEKEKGAIIHIIVEEFRRKE
jgi:hypothetical protein